MTKNSNRLCTNQAMCRIVDKNNTQNDAQNHEMQKKVSHDLEYVPQNEAPSTTECNLDRDDQRNQINSQLGRVTPDIQRKSKGENNKKSTYISIALENAVCAILLTLVSKLC